MLLQRGPGLSSQCQRGGSQSSTAPAFSQTLHIRCTDIRRRYTKILKIFKMKKPSGPDEGLWQNPRLWTDSAREDGQVTTRDGLESHTISRHASPRTPRWHCPKGLHPLVQSRAMWAWGKTAQQLETLPRSPSEWLGCGSEVDHLHSIWKDLGSSPITEGSRAEVLFKRIATQIDVSFLLIAASGLDDLFKPKFFHV